MTEKSRQKGFIEQAGIRYVWDLAADAYVPVIAKGIGQTDIGPQEVAEVSEDLEGLAPEDLRRRDRTTVYGGEVRGDPDLQRKRRRRGGG